MKHGNLVAWVLWLAIGGGAFLISPSYAHAQAKANPSPAMAKRATENADTAKKRADDIDKEAANAKGKVKEAFQAAAAALRASEAAQMRLSKAYEAGIAADVTKAGTDATTATETARRAEDRARTLVTEAVYRDLAPVEAYRKGTPAAAMPKLDALLVARTRAADDLLATADAITSPKTVLEIEEVRDRSLQSMNDYTIALRVYTNARDAASREEAAAKSPNPDITRKAIEKLKKHDEDTVSALKQFYAIQIATRKADRARAAILAEIDGSMKK